MSELTQKGKRGAEGFTLVREIATMLNSSLELDQVLEKILQACVRFSSANTGSLLIVDEAKKELKLAKAFGVSEEMAKDFRLKLGEGITGYVAKTGKSLVAPDVDQEPRFIRLRKKVKSEMAVPIFDRGKVVGVISVDSFEKNAFSKEDLEVLETVASLAGQVLRNASAFQMREQKIRELALVNRINQIFSQSLDLRKAFDQVVSVLKKELKMERATLVLLDTATGEFEIKIADGLTEEQIKRGRYRVGEGITGEVVKTGKAIGVPDISREPRFLDRTGARLGVKHTKTISFMCVPIKIQDQVIGVLSVDKDYESEEQFKADLEFLEIISGSLAQAIRIHMRADEMRKELEERNIYLRSQLSRKYSFSNIIGQSKPMQEVFERIQAVAGTRATVLIRGESGTGKELVAKAIHFNSPWKEKPFIKVDCASIPETLLESELFGHTRGSFTGAIADKKGKFELADGGTIFLDEIGELPLSLQAKILRVLQERVIEPIGSNRPKAISVRVITATNQNLEERIKLGLFREDLYYRLNVVPIYIPPLRERREDIPYLVDFFLDKFNKENKKQLQISPELMAEFLAYNWYGNVRELENTIERLVIICQDKIAKPGHISFPNKIPETLPSLISQAKEQKSLADLEKQAVLDALKRANGSQVQAAKILGITLRKLRYRMQKYGIKKDFVIS